MEILAIAPQPTPDEAAAIEAGLRRLCAEAPSVRARGLWKALGMSLWTAGQASSWRAQARLEQVARGV